MNLRQQKYKKNRILGMSRKSAALEAGYSFNYATRRANVLERVVNMDEWLERQGLSDKFLADHAKKGLLAEKAVSTSDGHSFINVPDWSVRHKYYETILRLRGKLKQLTAVDQSKHTYYTIQKLSKEMNGTDGRFKANAPQAIPGPGPILSESLKRFSVEEANGNNGGSEGQAEGDGTVS